MKHYKNNLKIENVYLKVSSFIKNQIPYSDENN